MTDVRALLPLYALGALDPDEAAAVERAVAGDPALAVELATYRDAAPALVEPVAPPPAIKARLLASIGGGPLERFSTRMAAIFDLGIDRAREVLGLVERPASWDTAAPGIHLLHFAGGPACASADCGMVRLADGTTFPPHVHLGEEVSLILAGRLRDHEGRELAAGDELVQVVGTSHHITAIGGDCLFATRTVNGIQIGGERVSFER